MINDVYLYRPTKAPSMTSLDDSHFQDQGLNHSNIRWKYAEPPYIPCLNTVLYSIKHNMGLFESMPP